MFRGVPHYPRETMIRLITVGVCALFLAGCGAEAKTADEGGKTPAVTEATTDTSAKFELGKPI